MTKPTAKTVAVYVRISTTDQCTEGQAEELRKWLDGNGINPEATEWYTDQETGTTLSREAMDRLQADIFAGKVKTVVCYKLDRLSRNLIDGMNLVASWADKGIRVVSTTQQVDVTGTMGKMMANMLFGFAQIETEYRAERQRAGIEAAKRRGVYCGRAMGTTKGSPKRAKELRAKGLQIAEIATALGTTPRTVHRYLA